VLQTLATFSGKVVPLNNSIIPLSGDSRQPQHFDFEGNRIAVKYDRDGNPWFDGPNLCKAAGIANASNAYARLDEDERVPLHILEGVALQPGFERIYVSESGLYNLILQSRKPAAKALKKHVTSVVLPSIRKNGGYLVQSMAPDELLVMLAQQNVDMRKRQEVTDREIKEVRVLQAQQAITLEDIREELLDKDFLSIDTWCRLQGIKEGMRSVALRSKWGTEASALSRAQGIEIKKATEELYVPNRYHKSVLQAVCIAKPKPNSQLRLIGDGK